MQCTAPLHSTVSVFAPANGPRYSGVLAAGVANSLGSASEYDRSLSIQVNAWEEKPTWQVPFSSPVRRAASAR